jgi:transketolase
MRQTFINNLILLAMKDKDIYLLTGDLGFPFILEFSKKFPGRFLNCGIAEQNMMGVAAGLALAGKKPYVFSFVPFVIFRCLEQIRNDVCYQNLNVKIIGAGSGITYGTHGSSHYGIEDVSVLKAFPNLVILSPADQIEMKNLILQSYKTKQPTYIRFEKNAKESFHKTDDKIILGKPSILRNGKDGLIITTGSSLETGIKTVKKLSESKYNLKLISLHTLKPINKTSLIKELNDIKYIFTIEDHKIVGGLYSSIAEILIENNLRNITLKAFGIKDKYEAIIGNQEYLRKYYKIDSNSIYKEIMNIYKKNGI